MLKKTLIATAALAATLLTAAAVLPALAQSRNSTAAPVSPTKASSPPEARGQGSADNRPDDRKAAKAQHGSGKHESGKHESGKHDSDD